MPFHNEYSKLSVKVPCPAHQAQQDDAPRDFTPIPSVAQWTMCSLPPSIWIPPTADSSALSVVSGLRHHRHQMAEVPTKRSEDRGPNSDTG